MLAHAASSVKLSWTIPTTRENGQLLSVGDLTGYEVYYTTDDLGVTGVIDVSGGTTTSYTVQNLAAGTYHFAMAAVDANGLKSKLSTVADVTLAASTAAPSSPGGTVASTLAGSTTAGGKEVSVSWVVPTTRSDGTPLSVSELSGYRIVLRSFFGTWVINSSVSGGETNSYIVSNVWKGLYVVDLVAIDNSGKQSASVYYFIYVN